MVYGCLWYTTIVNGVYKPTYNWGGTILYGIMGILNDINPFTNQVHFQITSDWAAISEPFPNHFPAIYQPYPRFVYKPAFNVPVIEIINEEKPIQGETTPLTIL
jgi:hypothetical protein